MSRPFKDPNQKSRSIPARLTLPQYRELSAWAKIKDISIQAMLRAAVTSHLKTLREEEGPELNFPSQAKVATMSDDEYKEWLDQTLPGGLHRPEDVKPKRLPINELGRRMRGGPRRANA